MAIKTAHHPKLDHQEQPANAEESLPNQNGVQVTPNGPPIPATDGPQEGAQPIMLNAAPSLSELTHLLRLEKYQRQRCRRIQQQLYSASVVAARTARLVHTSRSVQRTLAECIKSEDKPSFVNLFNAFNDSVSDCCEPPKVDSEDDRIGHEESFGYPPSFLDALSVHSRATILDFLTRVRQDGHFIADRLSALSHKDLVALFPEKGLFRSEDSVFGSSPRSSLRMSKHLGFVVDSQTELLSSHEMATPLEVLVHSTRSVSCGRLEDDNLATDVWATVCARLISERKPGSEKLVPAVLELWASSSSWTGKGRLGLWLLQTLQKGSVLLEQHQKQSFSVRLQAKRQDPSRGEANQLETFYADAVDSLLRLVADPTGASVVPEGVRKFCSAVFNKLEPFPRHQRPFPNFVLTRWLFSTFLIEAITLPEMHGLLLDYFISDNTRQRILREIASRCQTAVFDVIYSWKHGGVVSAEKTNLVRDLGARFGDLGSSGQDTAAQLPEPSQSEDVFVALTSTDVTILVNSLYPAPRPSSLSDHDLHSGLRSSASSISGFSLFQNLGALDLSPSTFPSQILDGAKFENLGQSEIPDAAVDSRAATDMDAQGLREACVGIEDFLNNRGHTTPSQWCMLVSDPSAQRLDTVHACLLKSAASSWGSKEAPPTSSTHKVCRNVIEELLQEGNLAQSHYSSAASEKQLSSVFQRILQTLNLRIKTLEETSNFVEAHSCFRKLRHFSNFSAEETYPSNLASLLSRLETDKQESLDGAASTVERCEAFIRSTRSISGDHSKALHDHKDSLHELRDKMWYVADVRVTAVYDEARSVASALRAMGKPQRQTRTRLTTTSRNGNGPRSPSTKSESQILDLLSAPPDHGGRSKLSDDHSRALVGWMERNTAGNFCKGEERLHKLCMEVHKAVDVLTSEGSTFRSSTLFPGEKSRLASAQTTRPHNTLWTLHEDRRRFDLLTLHTDVRPLQESLSNGSSHPLSTKSSKDFLESWSPSVTNRSSATFWSPVMTEARSPSSVTSIGSSQTQGVVLSASNKQSGMDESRNLTEKLRQRTTGLLLSDLGSTSFGEGSETDRAFWTGFGGELTEKYLRNLYYSEESLEDLGLTPPPGFDFSRAFHELTLRFSASCSPFVKLKVLSDMDSLLAPYMAELAIHPSPLRSRDAAGIASRGNPRPSPRSMTGDIKVEGFKRLFSNKTTRPEAIFRDLQYIATFVPSSTLDNTQQGKAFWSAAAAVSSLKRGACNVMVETADSIIAHHSNNRGHGSSSSVAQRERDSAAFSSPNPSPSPEDIGERSMSDAACLLQITAKEGYPVAQRELATLYLTHPELMEHIIAPFSRPREVFKEELESKWRKNQDPARCDPATMCVAHHWMSLSSKGGDALATEFLRQREEMERLP